MRIECPDCHATYSVPAAEKTRRARCKKCGALMTIEAEAPDFQVDESWPERRTRLQDRKAPPLLVPAIVVAVASLLIGLLFVPGTILVGVGTVAMAADDGARSDEVGMAFFTLVSFVLIGTCLVGGGVGLLIRKAWGWWATVLMFAFFLLLNARLITPILHLNWDHPRASDLALGFALRNGVPIVVSTAMLALLFLPKMRLAYGVKETKRVRHRSAGRLHSPK